MKCSEGYLAPLDNAIDTLCKVVALSHQVELPHQNPTRTNFLTGINPN